MKASELPSAILVGIEVREGIEKIRLIVEEPVLEVDRERQRVQHVATRRREVVHHLEGVVLVQDVLGRSMIRGQPVFAAIGRRHGIEIDVEREGAEVAVDIDTVVLEPQLLVQMA
jgi:hypothetical protein